MFKVLVLFLATGLVFTSSISHRGEHRSDRDRDRNRHQDRSSRSNEQNDRFGDEMVSRSMSRINANAMKLNPDVEKRDIQAEGIIDAMGISEQLKSKLAHRSINFMPRALPSQPGSGGGIDYDYFRDQAMKLWLQKLFLQVYYKMDLPSASEASNAKQTYDELKLSGFDAKGTSGVVTDLPNSKIKQVIDLWVGQNLISTLQGEELKTVMDGKTGQKEIKEMPYKNSSGDIIYSIVGYISLRTSLSQQEPTGTVVYAFGRFKFSQSPDVKRSESSSCVLWGLICKTTVTFTIVDHPLSSKQQTDLQTYMKYTVLKDFNERNDRFIEYLQAECDRYQRFLPETFSNDVKKIDSNPDKRPDQVVSQDVFNPNNYLPPV